MEVSDERATITDPMAARMAVAVAAKLACSGVFVSGRQLDEVVRRDLVRLSPLMRSLDYRLDPDRGTVTATQGGVSATALYRPGVGATLFHQTSEDELLAQAASLPAPRPRPRGPWPAGDDTGPAETPALERALDELFGDETADGEMDTRAVVVVSDGALVAERYAPGFGRDTRLLGWSASKSVLGTLVGLLIDDGRLALHAPAPVAEWRAPGDSRGAITLNHLLQMSSGLKFDEPYEPGADSTVMLFERDDMGAYAAASPLLDPPGAVWCYSSGTTNLLARIVLETVGGDMAAVQTFARTRLFEPAGMASAVFEPDARGSVVGSSYLYATARDWARFGQLYLDGGVSSGNRILSREWVDYVQQPVPASELREYGAHFRLNPLREPGGQAREYPNLPPDMYLARGHNRQIVAIMPSHGVVIVRLGWTINDLAFDLDRHFSAILRALGK